MMWMMVVLLVGPVFAKDNNPEENAGINEPNLFEGDIILSPHQRWRAHKGLDLNGSGRKRGSSRFSLWPRGVVAYHVERVLARNPRAMAAIRAGMNEWITKTCIRFRQRSNEASYVMFKFGYGCSSYIGRTGKLQDITLGKGCWTRGVVAHEIGHAVGFFHEQSRPDRNNFVTIVWNNIPSDKRNNFRKYGRSYIDSLRIPYDYASLMHYGSKAFSRNGQPTILVKRSGVVIGQRDGLSVLDAKQANLLYGNECTLETTCQDGAHGFCSLVAVSCRFSGIVRSFCKKTCNLCN